MANLHPDLLLEILKHPLVGLLLPSCFTQFAEAWHRACFDEPRWQCLDFSMLRSHYIWCRGEPYVYVTPQSELTLGTVLALMLELSQERIRTLIFHYNLFLSDEQFAYTAQSCPNLRRLVMPAGDRITGPGIRSAIYHWKDLESLTMLSIADPECLLREISVHCRKFRELKIMRPCDMRLAQFLAYYLPNLKVLSLRCTTLDEDVLIFILEELKHLEVLNISHCILKHEGIIRTEIAQNIRRMASGLHFITCMDDSCIMCQQTRADGGLVNWDGPKEGLWKADEVPSLSDYTG